MYIYKANGKLRPLGIPVVVDRVIQQAIAQKLTPIYEKLFSNNSYSFRTNRDCYLEINKALEYINNGYEWVFDLDIEKYFDTVNHDNLKVSASKTKVVRQTKSEFLEFTF